NVVYLQSLVRHHSDLLMFNGDYPHPNLQIDENVTDTQLTPYHFENRTANAALMVTVEGQRWPAGYSAWRGSAHAPRCINVTTPVLLDERKHPVGPTAVYTMTRLNHAVLVGAKTATRLRHMSPIVWRFAGRTHPPTDLPAGYALEIGDDASWVSWMPPPP